MNTEQLTEKTADSKLIFDGKVLKLYYDTVTCPDGKSAMREYCRHRGGVCVIPLTDNGELLCVSQYRYPHAEITMEIPAGKLEEKDSDHRAAALRELKEETGAECETLTYLGKIYPSPAIMDEVIHMYLAEGLRFGQAQLDDDEFLECRKIPLNELYLMLNEGKIPDAKTQIAILRAREIYREKIKQ